jgi:hypothetical protein
MPVFDTFPRMRRRRAASEYPAAGTPTITTNDAHEAITFATAILTATRDLIVSNRLDVFEVG